MSGKLVLVTGATGFIAGHVVNQLLEKRYRVRGTTRGSKVKVLSDSIKVPGLEFTRVDDVATSDLTEALKGVDAVIHVASPLAGRTNVDDTLDSAVDGTLNVMRQVAAAGIEKIVITSSVGAMMDPAMTIGFAGISLNDSRWGEVTREEARAHSDSEMFVYIASKILAERAVWEFAKEHLALDVATILPGFVYGPYAAHFPLPGPNGLGTNGYINNLMTGGHPVQTPPSFVDVRDVARAHVLALDLPRKPLEKKRFLCVSNNYTWKEAAEYLHKMRPDLKVAALDTFPAMPGTPSLHDTTRAEKVLKIGGWIAPEKTLLDTVDALTEVKKTWA